MVSIPEIGTAGVVRTQYWHRLDDRRAQCDLCPRECRLAEGQRGFCFIRGCKDGEIVLTSYGRASGFCVDPIEKKPLYHYLPGSAVLSFGTAGCNLACKFCQNWVISKSRQVDSLTEEAAPESVAKAAARLGCVGVALTYNDPVVFHEYAVDTARACRDRGLRTVAVTSGSVQPAPRADFYEHVDAVNVDLKAFTERFYRRLCGATLAPVLETLLFLRHETQTWLEITTLLIPGENDSAAEIDEMSRWVVRELGPDVPWHFTAFQPAWRMHHKPPTPPATLRRARAIAQENGVRHAYTGNVRDEDGSATRCHDCGHVIVGRDGYALSTWRLAADGRCYACNTSCPGVFEERPGLWGERRLPVRLRDFGS